MPRARRFSFALMGAAAIVAACSSFRTDATPGGAADAADAGPDGVTSGDAAGDDGAPVDAAPESAPPKDAAPNPGDSPPDQTCAQPWLAPSHSDPACASRAVITIDTTALDTRTVSIAVTDTNRVGILYDAMQFADSGDLRIATFPRPSSAPADAGALATITPITSPGIQDIGYVSAIARSSTDTFHVLYQVAPDAELHYQTFDGQNRFGPVETVATGVGDPAYVALATAPSGDLLAAYFNPATHLLVSKMRTGNAWTNAIEVTSPFPADAGVAGLGQVVAVVDPLAGQHVAFHASQISGMSDPRYASFNGSMWTQRSLESGPSLGNTGFGIGLAVSGDTKYAAYFAMPDGQQTAELRVASWVSTNDQPQISVIAQQLPLDGPDAPRFRLAMAIDPWGLLHVAVIVPSDAGAGVLEYHRQQRVGGKVTWLVDTIDADVIDPNSGDSFVALAVDADGRPHVAYYRGTDGTLRYATRFDRP